MSEVVSSTQYPSRSKLQRECNDLDCELYRLIGRAERLAEEIKVAGPKLRYVVTQLRKARPGLRELMHIKDRIGTEG